jgi:hypothetical protein
MAARQIWFAEALELLRLEQWQLVDMIGDQTDFQNRLRTVLPASWFPDYTPVLDTLLSGLGTAWVLIYTMLQYVTSQTRITSASDIWLDLIAWDFFGRRLRRRSSEGDDALRSRIMLEMFRERATRLAVESVLQDLTGRSPIIFEPARTSDTGGYASLGGKGGGVAYNSAGGWGNLGLPFQCFVTAYRPNAGGIGQVTGWGDCAAGYGVGAIEYASLGMVQAQVTDADIYSAIMGVLPVATIAWTNIID